VRKSLLIPALILLALNGSAGEVENFTVELSTESEQVFVDGEEAVEGSYSASDVSVPYISTENALGLVSFGELQSINYIEEETSVLQITQSSGPVLVPNTRGDYETVERRSTEITDRSFLDNINPNFGFSIPEQAVVQVAYSPDYLLSSEEDSLGSRENIEIEHKGLQDGEINIGLEIW